MTEAPIRVADLARRLGMDNTSLAKVIRGLGIQIKNRKSLVTPEQVEHVLSHITKASERHRTNTYWNNPAFAELIRVFHQVDQAVLLAARAGFPRARLPNFTTSTVFWTKVAEDAENGVLRNGIRPIMAQAAEEYPENKIFSRFLAEYRLTQGGTANGQLEAPSPAPNSIAERLDAAYLFKEQLTIQGENTDEINKAILSLRREQRDGPTLNKDDFLGEGRFRLLEIVGQGGFATVWKAYDRKENDLVAIKVLHGQFARDASRRERLFRGARRMAKIQHPHVVRVLVPQGEEQGYYYYVMECASRGDLHHAILNNHVTRDQGMAIVQSIAEALVATHAKGLVHRDVKPQNILIRGFGSPALTDFDLVHAKDTTGGTRTGALGTVIYSAPEQNQDAKNIDHRADIFSLGMTAIFCIFGKDLPFSVMYRRDEFMARLVCSNDLLDVLTRAVSLEADQRFSNMEEFRSALAEATKRGINREYSTNTRAGRDTLDSAIINYLKSQSNPVRALDIRKGIGGTAAQIRTRLNYLIERGMVVYKGRASGTLYKAK